MDVDKAQSMLGKYGKYQLLYYVIICLATNIPGCWHTLATFFHGIVPDHHCKIPSEEAEAAAASNRSWIPFDATDPTVSRCFVYDNLSFSNATVRCSNAWNDWEYSGDVTKSIVSKWNLVCDRAYQVKMAQTVLVSGVMTGALVFSLLADIFGRRPIFLICEMVLVVVGVVNAYVSNYYVYLVLRFLTGTLQQGLIVIGTIMVCELFPADQRTFAGIFIENFWALSHCLLAFFSFFVPNWTNMQLIVSLSGLLTIPLFWFLPESVPWLCANDCYEEAEQILERAAKMNGITLPKHLLTMDMIKVSNGDSACAVDHRKSENFIARYKRLRQKRKNKALTTTKDSEEEATVRYTLLDLIRHGVLRKHAAVMGIIWLAITYVYYGITLNSRDLAGNRYLNFFLVGLVEIPAYTLSFFVIKTWGRRLPLLGFHILAGVPLMASVFIPESAGGVNLGPLKTVFVMTGKFGITAAFGIVFLYSPELFPTTLRSLGTGISSFCGRIGNMSAPFATALDVYAPWLSAIVYGTVSIGCGLLVLILPETLNRPLPQSIEEIENWSKTTHPKQTKNANETLKVSELQTFNNLESLVPNYPTTQEHKSTVA